MNAAAETGKGARVAIIAALLGLVLEALSLTWIGPEAFLTFLVGSGLLLGGAMLLSLRTLLRGGV